MSTKVDQLLSGKLFQVKPDETIAKAIGIMRNERISCIVAVDDQAKAAGILTERDVMRLVHHNTDLTQPISEVMSSPVLSASADTSVFDAYEMLKCGDIRHLVVTDCDKVAGVLTHSDLLRAVSMMDLLHKKRAMDVMLPTAARVAPDDLLFDVIAMMVEREETSVVVTSQRQPVGIITERDIPAIIEKTGCADGVSVADVMSSPVITVDLNVSAYESSEMLQQHSIRQLVVVDHDGFLVGLVTQTSLLTAFETRYVEHMRTQLSHAKQRLSKSVLLTNIMNSEIDSAIIALDEQMVVAISNPAASTLFSYDDKSLAGYTLQNLLVHGHFPSLDQERIISEVKKKGHYRKSLVKGNGESTLDIEFSAIKEGDEQLGYLLMAKDMTEHLQLEEQFRQSQKMESLGTLVGGIAHDFNNMLAGMTGNIYLARSLVGDNPTVNERLEVVEQLGFRAAKMIQQLLTFARKDRVQMKLFGLSSFMQEILQLNSVVIPENIEFNCDIPAEDLVILGDETQLQQVIMNLLNNAHDAVSGVREPKVELLLNEYSADREFISRHPQLDVKQFARLSIVDNGCGISTQEQAKIFDPFYTTKEVGKGTGLGLSMAYGAIENHHGVIEVDSCEGQGTSFHIYLPLVKEAGRSQQLEKAFETIKGHGETILLVDDEERVREVGEAVLTSLNYQVLTATDGETAVQLFREKCETIDLVILDLVMPRLGGGEAARRMQEIRSDVPVIFATAYDREEAMASTTLPESCTLLLKPYQVGEMSQVIRSKLEGSGDKA
ncbi:CBS domain-containing protein [Mariprofundus sp. KV]|uniref:CBS domain-containing protein n=1 Tax=Mariprofundus sp. KV TaxID=2608715 RepID=UPI0015A07ECC|nr:CBS domain-containing protein [Mariprofundus sp. KV]NWF36093.1 CBS domain-containing protein [Mariprofundus sp. KV]